MDWGDDLFRTLVEASHDFIGTIDRDGNFLYLNRAGRRLLEIPEDESLVGQSVAPYNAPPSDELRARAAAILETGEEFAANVFVTRTGKHVPVSQSFIAHETSTGTVYSTIARDVTDRLAVETTLREQADRDPLTGLLNRAAVRRMVAEGRMLPGTFVAVADLDNFKGVNDNFGHHVGDELLVEVARSMQRTLPQAVLARFGGDEFVICSERADIRFALEQALIPVLASYGAGVSVGVACVTGTSPSDFELAMRTADEDLYAMKRLSHCHAAQRGVPVLH